jgi:CubicO group peptidase (beta-lactamase class C family)
MLSRLPILILLAGACLAQNAARMDQIVQSYVANRQFMGSALVARGPEVVYSKGFGSADLEWEIPNTPNTKFRLGSITKQFTAASILLLQERGKLNIADAVKKYLPDAPAAWDKVTIYHVLTHTSGIASFTGFPEYAKLRPFPATPVELLARFRDKPLEFEPGERWNYSNSGYVLLGYLIEKISGQTYERFVQENIFTVLGMKDSGYDSNSAIIARRAAGYVSRGDRFEHAGYIHMSIPQGAGALYSTTEDLLKWEQGLFGGKVLQAASLEKMTTPFKNDYALGVSVATEGGRKVIQHGGGIEGFNTQLSYYPEDKLTVVVLGNVNGSAPGDIAKKLAALARGETVRLQSERKEIPLDPKVLSRYVGAYRLVPAGDMLIALNGNQLTSKLGSQAAIPIFPESETMFFLKAVDAQLEFPKVEGDGKASALTLHQNGRSITGKRLDGAEAARLAEAGAAAAKRFQDQKAAPGSDAALRKMIEDLRAGKPDYEGMSSGLAAATRQQLPQLQSTVKRLGAAQSLTFTGVGPGGADIYTVKFENGSVEYRILLGPDGKVESATVRPVQ